MLPGAGLSAVPSSPPAARTGRALCDSLCAPCCVPCAQDDTCLAELALALSLSLEMSSKQRLVGVRLCVHTLQAELHEGLFCSPLLHHVTAGAQHSTVGEEPSTGQDKDKGQALCSARAGRPLEPEGFGCGIAPSCSTEWGFGQVLSVTLSVILQAQGSPRSPCLC